MVDEPAAPKEHVTLRAALGLFRITRFRVIALVGSGLGLLTVSDAFVYLVIQRQTHLDVKWFPLLFLGTAMAYLGFAVPIGRIADRVGRGRVFLAGHLALLGVYLVLRFADLGAGAVLCTLLLFGLYYASTDGVLMALASPTIPERLRTSGFALITTGTATTRFMSSVAFGAIWVAWGAQAAMLVFLVGLAVMVPAAAIALAGTPRRRRRDHDDLADADRRVRCHRGRRAPRGGGRRRAAPAEGPRRCGRRPAAVPVSRALVDAPHVVFRDTTQGADCGRWRSCRSPTRRPARHHRLSCDRVYVAGRRGLCLFANRGVITTHKGVIFTRGRSARSTPSRCRAIRAARAIGRRRLVAYTVSCSATATGPRLLDADLHPRRRAAGSRQLSTSRRT